jgi:hypothetical protein
MTVPPYTPLCGVPSRKTPAEAGSALSAATPVPRSESRASDSDGVQTDEVPQPVRALARSPERCARDVELVAAVQTDLRAVPGRLRAARAIPLAEDIYRVAVAEVSRATKVYTVQSAPFELFERLQRFVGRSSAQKPSEVVPRFALERQGA